MNQQKKEDMCQILKDSWTSAQIKIPTMRTVEIGFYSYSSEIASFLASCVHREDDKSSPDEPWSTPPRGQSLVPRPCHTGGGGAGRRRGRRYRVIYLQGGKLDCARLRDEPLDHRTRMRRDHPGG